MTKCCALFVISVGAFAITAFYHASQFLIETLNDWSFQMAGAAAPMTPLSSAAMPVAQARFFQSYSLTPIHQEVLSFIDSPLVLIICCLVVCTLGFGLWLQSRAFERGETGFANETLLRKPIPNQTGIKQGYPNYAVNFFELGQADERTDFGPQLARDLSTGLS